MTDTRFMWDECEDYPTQRRLVDALADHDIDVHEIRTRSDAVTLRLPVEDARRLTELLKEPHDHR